MLKNYSIKDIYRTIALLTDVEGEGITDSRFLRQKLQRELDRRGRNDRLEVRKIKHGADRSMVRCTVCGGPAVVVPVNTGQATMVGGGYAVAIQCQNRPTKDNTWLPSHCGHTEYRGDTL